MPRKRKYTPKAFDAAVNDYFSKISRRKVMQELVPTGRTNKEGMPVMEWRDIVNDAGEKITSIEYVVPPQLTSLCLHLGICRDTFAEYAKDTRYSDTVKRARGRVEEYLHIQLDTRKKGLSGIIFDLQCNHRWSPEHTDASDAAADIKITGIAAGLAE